MNKIETQVNKLFKDIPDSERKDEILQEIKQNLNEKVEDIISQGLTEDEAVKKTIEDFGDIREIRKELVSSARLEQSKNIGLSLAFSVWGAILLTALFLFVNLYYTPNNIWCVYPVFAVVWWPMAMYFRWLKNKRDKSMAFPFSIASFLLITALMLFINFYYTPNIIWFVYPVFAIVWWPVALFFHMNRTKNRKDADLEQEN
jgi:hypothetical protein